jgi:hypothetical protein
MVYWIVGRPPVLAMVARHSRMTTATSSRRRHRNLLGTDRSRRALPVGVDGTSRACTRLRSRSNLAGIDANQFEELFGGWLRRRVELV